MSLKKTNAPIKSLAQLRLHIAPNAYRHSKIHVLFWCILDLVLYVAFMMGVYYSQGMFLRLFFGLLAGIATSSLFVLAHDAAHGSLIKRRWLAEIIGTLYMLPALNIYRLWCFGHNRIHHGFTSYSPVDWIWRPLSLEEYKNLSRFKKGLYRCERSLWGCGLHYLTKVWWPEMICFMPEKLDLKKRRAIQCEKVLIVAFSILVVIVFYQHAGFFSAICALIVPFIVFNYVISLIVYLHHTHPDLPFYNDKSEWNQLTGALFCTTVIHSPWLIEKAITHHILIHTPHHVDIRIPFYRLTGAFNDIKAVADKSILEYTISLNALMHIFKTCKCYDYKHHVWHGFND